MNILIKLTNEVANDNGKVYSVYGLYAGDENFYVGHSINVRHRLYSHLRDARIGLKVQPVSDRIRYLAQGITPRLEVWETFPTKAEAVAREEFLTWYIRDYAGVDLANEKDGNRHSLRTRGRNRNTHVARRLKTQQTQRKMGLRSNNTSGCKGVWLDRRRSKWQAWICTDGKRRYIGSFDNLEDAIAARKAGEIKFWGTPKKTAA